MSTKPKAALIDLESRNLVTKGNEHEQNHLSELPESAESRHRDGRKSPGCESARSEKISGLVVLGTSWRESSPEVALAAARAAREFAGISRVARVDGLSGLPFPVFSATRPLSKISVTVSAGKGTSSEESRLSALFEAIEIAAAETELPQRLATTAETAREGTPFLTLESLAAEDDGQSIAWCEVESRAGAKVLCPVAAVSMLPTTHPFVPHTNGLASGTTFSEALFHGLLEVLERHAWSLALVKREAVSLDLSSIEDPFLNEVRRELDASGLVLEVKDLSRFIDVPCYYSVIYSPGENDSHLFSGGMGCHLDPLLALRRAVSESLQSRAVVIAGAREDIEERPRVTGEAFADSYELFRFWYEPTEEKVALPASFPPPANLEDAIEITLSRAKQRAPELGELHHYRLPAPAGIEVVRAILPGAELFCLAPERLGPTLRPILADI